jgi:hypothetical protein
LEVAPQHIYWRCIIKQKWVVRDGLKRKLEGEYMHKIKISVARATAMDITSGLERDRETKYYA